MKIKTVEDAFALQKDSAAHLEAHLAGIVAPARQRREAAPEDHAARLAHAKARLAATTKERDDAVRRWDERVQRDRDEIDRLRAAGKRAEHRPAPGKKTRSRGTKAKRRIRT